jgi:hypothetical protein
MGKEASVQAQLRRWRPFRVVLWCVTTTLVASACDDGAEDPFAIAVAPGTDGAVAFSHGLATFPHLLGIHGMGQESAMEAEAWSSSWSLSEEEGTRLRSRIYPLVVEGLLTKMGTAGIQDLLARNGTSLATVEAMGATLPLTSIADALQEARGHHEEARGALDRGEEEAALIQAFQTADALWQVTPNRVASDLIRRATDAFGRKETPQPYSKEELIRIRRLVYGASEALDDGDYPRAIRRAYYACQLLGVDPH